MVILKGSITIDPKSGEMYISLIEFDRINVKSVYIGDRKIDFTIDKSVIRFSSELQITSDQAIKFIL